jgi:hypothetical protein
MILRNGGTVNLDSIGTWNQPANGLLDIPGSYGQPAVDFLAFCGVDYNNFPSSSTPGIPSSYGLRAMLLFPSEDWGTDTVVQNRVSPQPWPDFLANTPFSPEAQAGIARIQTDTTTDWIALKHGPKTDQEKKASRSSQRSGTSATATASSARACRRSRPATPGPSARRGSTASGSTPTRSRA